MKLSHCKSLDLSKQQIQWEIRKHGNKLRQLVRALRCERTTAQIMDLGIKGVSLLSQDKVSDNILYKASMHWQRREGNKEGKYSLNFCNPVKRKQWDEYMINHLLRYFFLSMCPRTQKLFYAAAFDNEMQYKKFLPWDLIYYHKQHTSLIKNVSELSTYAYITVLDCLGFLFWIPIFYCNYVLLFEMSGLNYEIIYFSFQFPWLIHSVEMITRAKSFLCFSI